MSVAIDHGDRRAMFGATVAMITMIVAVDQLVWRPALAWAQKFKVEETEASEGATSWALELLRRSRIVPWVEAWSGRLFGVFERRQAPDPTRAPATSAPLPVRILGWAVGAALLVLAVLGAARLVALLAALQRGDWLRLGGALGLTFLRTYTALAFGALWTVPVGIWIGLSPRRMRILQPIIQVAAAFPAPMIFPLVTLLILAAGIPFAWGCAALMLLGSQWYILFNVLAGAAAMPHDLREVVEVYGLTGWARWKTLYLPAVFPYLVTGLVTAAGGAWNASIVAEYVRYRGETLIAPGLGSLITTATAAGNFPLLAAGVMTMSLAIVAFNRTVWRRVYRLADERFSLNR
jgi:NitT/TauT family transport system permease protein